MRPARPSAAEEHVDVAGLIRELGGEEHAHLDVRLMDARHEA